MHDGSEQSLKKATCDLKDHTRQHGLIKQRHTLTNINSDIPANFFWVKCVRFSPCHDRVILENFPASSEAGFPIVLRSFLNFTENS